MIHILFCDINIALAVCGPLTRLMLLMPYEDKVDEKEAYCWDKLSPACWPLISASSSWLLLSINEPKFKGIQGATCLLATKSLTPLAGVIDKSSISPAGGRGCLIELSL